MTAEEKYNIWAEVDNQIHQGVKISHVLKKKTDLKAAATIYLDMLFFLLENFKLIANVRRNMGPILKK